MIQGRSWDDKAQIDKHVSQNEEDVDAATIFLLTNPWNPSRASSLVTECGMCFKFMILILSVMAENTCKW